ncbi:MAG: endonuclease/exonuclease/phosphatase family protein [Deinococcales bacterium]|nr:endonuclease/exonuclease/phosphatase family protein [Chitinophagaceae bacterium]
MLVCCVLSFFLFRKYWWLFFLLIFIGYKNILSTTGFNFKSSFEQSKPPNTFRLLSWNVNEFSNNQVIVDTPNNLRRKILAFIETSKADILCFQDFRDYTEGGGYYSSLKYIAGTLHYQYHYFSIDQFEQFGVTKNRYGCIIFSKFPIIDTGRIANDYSDSTENLSYADIQFPKKVIRIYNTHLRSMLLTYERKIEKKEYTYLQDDTAILLNRGKLKSINYFDSVHIKQAEIIKHQLNNYPKPFIFCADLNSVPSSYVYHYLKKGLNDAFLNNGSGWGSTYNGLSNTLRIDVTLLSPQLKTKQYYCPKLLASDHYPTVIDFMLP